jgi:hypothetical protein
VGARQRQQREGDRDAPVGKVMHGGDAMTASAGSRRDGGDRPLLLLTTKGARSGRSHTAPLVYVADGGRLLVARAGGQ